MPGLQTPAFTPLPLTNIEPQGWLRHVLEVQAQGLTGHLDEFWPDVAQSGWIGGQEEGWERAPYWLDGLVPLAWHIGDERLKEKARTWIEAILEGQHPNGWLGARVDRSLGASRPGGPRDYPIAMDAWPRFILLKVLIQYHEATGDQRIPVAIARFLRCLADVIDMHPLRAWARYRWADLLVSIYWLHERTGDDWLLDLASDIQAQGFDWRHHAGHFPYRYKTVAAECDLSSHGPNNAMGVKAGAIAWRLSGDEQDIAASDRLIEALDRFHGQATGMFSCDEHLAGREPSQGAELCAVVEYMYSLEQLVATAGQVRHADRLEQLAFNALPATISADMWTHQYDQQVNQVMCAIAPDRVYTSNGPDANLFGLEPHFGCCTANMHQGWPKLTSHAWMRSQDGGLVAVSYVPCHVSVDVDGAMVEAEVKTTYPFGSTISIRIDPGPYDLPVLLRIPEWAPNASVQMNGVEGSIPAPGTLHRIMVPGGQPSMIELDLNPDVRIERRSERSVAVYRGPLLYALPIAAEWRELVHRETVSDWTLEPRSPWNVALLTDEPPAIAELDPPDSVFGSEIRPETITIPGVTVPGWRVERSAAAPIPLVEDADLERAVGVTLVPYGLTSLRIGEFPVVSSATSAAN